jgi:hypothetical protein
MEFLARHRCKFDSSGIAQKVVVEVLVVDHVEKPAEN